MSPSRRSDLTLVQMEPTDAGVRRILRRTETLDTISEVQVGVNADGCSIRLGEVTPLARLTAIDMTVAEARIIARALDAACDRVEGNSQNGDAA